MSLLIKALDKAQEEAQTAKGKQKAKQSEAERAQQTKVVADTDTKRQPSPLNPAANSLNLSLSNAASEKMAAANALELELSPNIKALSDDAVKPAIYIKSRTENSQDTKHTAIETPKPANTSLPSAVSTSRAFASSKSNDSDAQSLATKTTAANVFAAKRIEANNQNSKIAFIVGVGLIVLTAIAAYFYQLVESDADLTFIAKRPAMPLSAQPVESAPPVTNTENVDSNLNPSATATEPVAELDTAKVSQEKAQQLFKAESAVNSLRSAQNANAFADTEAESRSVKVFKEPKQTESNRVEVEHIASRSASIQVSKTTELAGVNPVLMRAYDAYNAGNDSDAMKLYKQVLQRDVRNVDALLGLGAIAQRQGRLQDANGWYGKVLELDPKNSIALGFNLAATLDGQPQNDVSNESRIKSMLAKQPDDASLYTTLGNFYADSNQWSAAQQAYFDAYRLNASADNAFNLAISLDQLGKPKVALPYYQRALQLSQTTRSNIDKAALEARIAAIQ